VSVSTVKQRRDAVRIGICGVGRTGYGRIRTEVGSLPEFSIAAAFDLIPERAEALAEMYGSRVHRSLESLLADEGVEVVVVATRSDTHADLAIAALKAGKHVVVEKPMATSLKDCDRILKVAAKSAGRLFARHNRRFDPPFLLASEVVKSGKLGAVHLVQLRVGEYVQRTDWQTLKSCGGGQLLNWGPHVIDWGLRLAGGKAVDIWSDLKLIAAGGDAEDHVKLLLRGPTGTVVDIEISGATSIKQPAWIVSGERGALWIDGDIARLRYLRSPPKRPSTASAATPGQDDKRYKSVADPSMWIDESGPVSPASIGNFWLEIYRTLRKGTEFPISLEQAREVIRVIDTARTGTPFQP
jgi:scyllo-inositol 2-dehydrogenase (NADP+)